ncbi:ZIP zinc transporter [Xylariales sp. AK1849]|nr:ZIP zinc transporter [Xylariales sp. AK1849]
MEAMGVDNDTRGWIMALVSGAACVLGASVICVDKIVRLFPGGKDFRIQDSSAFLASSLSLSFGVMIFMSLYSMLPEAKNYLKKGGFAEQAAGLTLIGCFVGGFIGIQAISRLFHQLLPSHVVDCDHSHDAPAEETHFHTNGTERRHPSRAGSVDKHHHCNHQQSTAVKNGIGSNGHATESTPLLVAETGNGNGQANGVKRTAIGATDTMTQAHVPRPGRSRAGTTERRPSLYQLPQRVMSFVKDKKANCEEPGCFGYSDPCSQRCFKHIKKEVKEATSTVSQEPTLVRTATGYFPRIDEDDSSEILSLASPRRRSSLARSREPHDSNPAMTDGNSTYSEDLEAQHHHHVAENAFLSIGLQTSIAIALHKFPEGFITYATNHANPSLGFSVFLALFVHNISEGFALALPLYMALNNRWKAMLWSFVLGGLSQPLGAGIAVLWFKVAKHTHMTPNSVAYGCLFAITAGIMASVALQLFVESLGLNHNRNLSVLFAFLGMALLGLSSAFTSNAH